MNIFAVPSKWPNKTSAKTKANVTKYNHSCWQMTVAKRRWSSMAPHNDGYHSAWIYRLSEQLDEENRGTVQRWFCCRIDVSSCRRRSIPHIGMNNREKEIPKASMKGENQTMESKYMVQAWRVNGKHGFFFCKVRSLLVLISILYENLTWAVSRSLWYGQVDLRCNSKIPPTARAEFPVENLDWKGRQESSLEQTSKVFQSFALCHMHLSRYSEFLAWTVIDFWIVASL